MRIALPALLLTLFAAAPVAAQATSVRVTASAEVVEGFAAAGGASTLSADGEAWLDVSTPLQVRGSADFVVDVSGAEQRRAGTGRVGARIPRARFASPEPVVFTISLVN